MKFLIVSEFGELLDLAIALKEEGHEVLFHVPEADYKKIGEGIVEKCTDPIVYMGKGYIYVFDGCSAGARQDWLRSKGELVFGGTEKSDKLENDRQIGQALFKRAGFKQVISRNFKSIDDGISFVKDNKDRKWILKQNNDAPKSINHKGQFDGGEDMLLHLIDLKKKWLESEHGKIDFDLMEVVEGLECAASGFFNGKEWMRNKAGRIVGFLNFEEKKEVDGNLGETTGEMGTTYLGVTEDNTLFREILMKPEVAVALRSLGYKGVFDINCIKTKDGIVALEATCRFGVPATSYELLEGLESPLGELISSVAKGDSKPIAIREGMGMVMVVAAKPYPVEADLEHTHTSLGEKLWVLQNGSPIKDFTHDQKKHIHLENFYKDDTGYRVASKNGYLLTVTASGKDIFSVRNGLIDYIKANLYISGMKYRSDIGVRVEEYYGLTKKDQLKSKYENDLKHKDEEFNKKLGEKDKEYKTESQKKDRYASSLKIELAASVANREKQDTEMKNIKKALRDSIYGE